MVIEKLMQTKITQKSAVFGLLRPDTHPIAWKIFNSKADYPETLQKMRDTARRIASGEAEEQVWLVEHPPLYTSGTSASPNDLIAPNRFPVYAAGRGGQFTYHGPGQRVAYPLLDLRQRGRDVRAYVQHLEGWIIDTLEAFNIVAARSKGRVGVWVKRPELGPTREDKIAAIGVRVSRWVSFHGISLNVAPDLSHYSGIVPCGISDQGVTSFEDLGHLVSMAEVDSVLREKFKHHFGPTILIENPTM